MTEQDDQHIPEQTDGWRRVGYLALGHVMLGFTALALALPLIPAGPPLVIALWAFSKSSRWLHRWLYTHPLVSTHMRNWVDHRVIAPSVKLTTMLTMAGGWTIYTVFLAESWVGPASVGAMEILIASYVLSRPSYPPAETTSEQ